MRAVARTEGDIRDHLKKRVAETDSRARKVTWDGHRGAPDWLLFIQRTGLYRERVWAELKKPDEQPDDGQQREIDFLRDMGERVVVLDSYDAIDALFGVSRK